MNIKTVILFLSFLIYFSAANAQGNRNPKEEIEKYGYIGQLIIADGENGISNKTLEVLDSAYALDSNSLFLKQLLLVSNSKLITDSLRTDRIPQSISIVQSLLLYSSEKEKHDYYLALASFYKHSGDFKKAISCYNNILSSELDTPNRNYLFRGIASFYLLDGHNKKALETLRLVHLPDTAKWSSILFAKVYYKNNLLDSALLYINKSLENGNNHYTAYTTKAKILKAQGKTDGICTLEQQAMDLIEKQKLEQMLEQRDKTNPFIQLQIKDIDETKQLKKEYCK